MTPDDIAILSGKIDRNTRQTADLTTAVKVLATEFKAHREAEGLAIEIREKTCPQNATINKLVSDVDAIAGTLRSVAGHVTELKTWVETHELDTVVDDTKKGVIFAPIKWAKANVEKIMLALVIAWLIAKFGI